MYDYDYVYVATGEGIDADAAIIQDMWDDFLNSESPQVDVAGYTFAPADVLREIEPIAYREGLLDFADMLARDGEILAPFEECTSGFELADTLGTEPDYFNDFVRLDEDLPEEVAYQLIDGEPYPITVEAVLQATFKEQTPDDGTEGAIILPMKGEISCAE